MTLFRRRRLCVSRPPRGQIPSTVSSASVTRRNLPFSWFILYFCHFLYLCSPFQTFGWAALSLWLMRLSGLLKKTPMMTRQAPIAVMGGANALLPPPRTTTIELRVRVYYIYSPNKNLTSIFTGIAKTLTDRSKSLECSPTSTPSIITKHSVLSAIAISLQRPCMFDPEAVRVAVGSSRSDGKYA